MLPCQPAPALCRPEQGAGYASPDSDVREQSQHRKGHGEQLSKDKRFQSLLTEAGFNLAGKGFLAFYLSTNPLRQSLPSQAALC